MAKKRPKAPSTRRHKFRANPTVVDDIRFASQREAWRYKQLKLLEKAGKIKQLERQVPFHIVMQSKYIADFVYLDEKGLRVVEDVKGFRTPEYKRKRRLMLEQHGIQILET